MQITQLTILIPRGKGIITNAIKWVVQNVVNPVCKITHKTISSLDFVFTHGYSGNAAFMGSGWGSIYVAFDTKGNIALQATGGIGGGALTASVTMVQSVMFALNIEALEGLGGQ